MRVQLVTGYALLGHPNGGCENLCHRELATPKVFDRLTPSACCPWYCYRVEVGQRDLSSAQYGNIQETEMTYSVASHAACTQVVNRQGFR
jgi:hypothetical protein